MGTPVQLYRATHGDGRDLIANILGVRKLLFDPIKEEPFVSSAVIVICNVIVVVCNARKIILSC